MLKRLGAIMESRVVRGLLIGLIVLSLLPFPEIERTFRWVFVVVFGVEIAVRAPLTFGRSRTRLERRVDVVFFLADLVAFVSFLPLDAWLPVEVGALKVLRLARLLVLLRFARDLAADVYSILTRREQLEQFALVTVAVGAMAFVSAVILSHLGVPHDYDTMRDGPEGFAEQVWWSFRQIESADNLVASLHVHPVVGVLSLVLTMIGVFVISFIIGIGTNVVEQVVRAERRRPVGFSGHTVVIGPIHENEVLIREFARIYMKNRRDVRDQLAKYLRWLFAGGPRPRTWTLPRMALLGPAEEPPTVLLEPGMRHVVYRQGDAGRLDALERIGTARAKRIILMSDPSAGDDADAITVGTLSAVRELNPHAHVFLELASSRNFATLKAIAENPETYPLDVPWLLGLLMLHHLIVPGVERLYRFLLTAEGSELYSHVYRDGAELDALARQGDEDGLIDAHALARMAADHGLVLVGVFLGAGRPVESPFDLIDLHGLVPWVNPHDEPAHEAVRALGGRAGKIPAAAIRGVIAVAETYQPVRTFARHLCDGVPKPAEVVAGDVDIGIAEPPPRRILVIGFGDAIASLTTRLADLTEGASVVVATDGQPEHVHALRGALSRAGVTLEEASSGRVSGALARGGRLELRAEAHGDPMETGLRVLAEGPVDAVVFVAERDAPDPDARTALRLLRLAEGMLAVEGPPPHVLAELASVAKGARARRQVQAAFERAGRPAPRVTLVSTQQIRNYFMVHSAFVPGIDEVYGQLLGEVGQDLVRLPVRSTGPVRMIDCAEAVRARRMVALALETADGEVWLNPPGDLPVDGVTGVFVIGEVDTEWTRDA